ncbi:MAG TPA: septum formation initiator family protein [Pyrinomonadaceae bacterium]
MRVANTYWVDERIKGQRVARRAASFASVREVSLDIIGSRADVRRRGGIIPAWVVFGMVLLATLSVCITVNMRTRAKMLSATEQYAIIQTDVETLRSANRSLQQEVNQMRSDPRAIEAAARSRLNMVRSNEIVVPVE